MNLETVLTILIGTIGSAATISFLGKELFKHLINLQLKNLEYNNQIRVEERKTTFNDYFGRTVPLIPDELYHSFSKKNAMQ